MSTLEELELRVINLEKENRELNEENKRIPLLEEENITLKKDLSDLLALLDKFYEKIELDKIEKKFRRVKIKELLKILLGDFARTKKIYPVELKNYKKMKRYLQKLRLL